MPSPATAHRSPLRHWLPWLLVTLSVAPLAWQHLVSAHPDHYQVDLEVYREAGVSLLQGRPVYDVLTAPPQSLPFTYPPFAALLAVPLAILSFSAAAWVWFVAQAVALVVVLRHAAADLLAGAGSRSPLLLGVLAAVAVHLLPASDGFRFGQVDAFLLLLCLLDVLRPASSWTRRLPQGVLIGLATGIKLTPGLFVVHLLVTRQWRAAATAIATAAGTALLALAVLPGTSWTFWTDALLDSDRLGANDGTSNQSLRGATMRLLPDDVSGPVWAVLVLATLVVALGAAARAHRAGRPLLAFTAVGLGIVLVSPVSWIHHYLWLVPGLLALVGRPVLAHRARLAGALVVAAVMALPLPWWGQWRLVDAGERFPAASSGHPLWTLLNNSYVLLGVLTLLWVAWLSRRGSERQHSSPG